MLKSLYKHSLWVTILLKTPESSVGKESVWNAGDPSSVPGSGRSAGEGIGYPLQYSWASLVSQLVKNPPAMREAWVQPWVGKIPWRRERLPTPVSWPGEFYRLCSPWGHKESDTTKQLSLSLSKTWMGFGKLFTCKRTMQLYMTLLLHVTLCEQISVWGRLKLF